MTSNPPSSCRFGHKTLVPKNRLRVEVERYMYWDLGLLRERLDTNGKSNLAKFYAAARDEAREARTRAASKLRAQPTKNHQKRKKTEQKPATQPPTVRSGCNRSHGTDHQRCGAVKQGNTRLRTTKG